MRRRRTRARILLAMRIDVQGLRKDFGEVTALAGVELRAEEGKVLGFLGPNGAGKSTTLRCLLGLVTPDAGRADIGGRPYRELRDPVRTVGALLDPEAHHPDRTGREHLRVLCDAAGLPRSRADEVLALVELERAADRRAGGYSLGMRQRLHLAAALLGDPPVLVLDEPANGLDPQGIRWLRDRLRALAGEGRTVLLSSHVLPEVRQTVDDVVVVAGGTTVTQGRLHDVLAPGGTALRVRSPEPGAVAALAARLGGRTRAAGVDGDGGTIAVAGLDAEPLARAALAAGVLLTLLEEREPDLEARYFELTGTA
jgi:ABC-2 type transport system ATP-binding protein